MSRISAKNTIEQTHKCRAELVEDCVAKVFLKDGQVLFSYPVETFALIGHPTARKAFAWISFNSPDHNNPDFTVVLGREGINTGDDALSSFFGTAVRATNEIL